MHRVEAMKYISIKSYAYDIFDDNTHNLVGLLFTIPITFKTYQVRTGGIRLHFKYDQ
jgi:hypothetical protein